MDLNEAIAAIQFRLGDRKDLAVQIEAEIRLAQERLELSPLTDPWFLVQQGFFVINEGDLTIDLPANFNRELDDGTVIASNGELTGIVKKATYESAFVEFNDATGAPQKYATRGDKIYIFPLPDKEYHLRFPYLFKDTVLSTTSEPVQLANGWLTEAPMVLVNKAGIAIAQALKNKESLKDFSNDFNVAFKELEAATVHREDVNTDIARVTS